MITAVFFCSIPGLYKTGEKRGRRTVYRYDAQVRVRVEHAAAAHGTLFAGALSVPRCWYVRRQTPVDGSGRDLIASHPHTRAGGGAAGGCQAQQAAARRGQGRGVHAAPGHPAVTSREGGGGRGRGRKRERTGASAQGCVGAVVVPPVATGCLAVRLAVRMRLRTRKASAAGSAHARALCAMAG